MVARARAQGFRVADKWERENLDPCELFTSKFGGPCFVKIDKHGDR